MCKVIPLDHKAYERLYYRERNDIPPDERTLEGELTIMETTENSELSAPEIKK